MPLSTYLNLGLGELAHTRLTVELADRTVKYPKGIAENVLVRIGKFTFPVDFIILDMPEDIKVPLILGRPFLSTARAKIDVYKRKITLRVGEEKIVFTSVKSASSLIKRVYMLSLRERMDLDLEARLMGETLVLNRSLDPFLEDYIELNDLNEPFELRRNQGDDLMPTIKEGEVIEEFRIRNEDLDTGIDDYPSYCDDDKKIHIDCAHNLMFSCMIVFEFTHANFFPLLYVNAISRKFHNLIMKNKMVYKGNNVVGALMNVPIFVGTFYAMTNFAVLENMDAYRDEGMGDVIFGEPFLREGEIHRFPLNENPTESTRNLRPFAIVGIQISSSLPSTVMYLFFRRSYSRLSIQFGVLPLWALLLMEKAHVQNSSYRIMMRGNATLHIEARVQPFAECVSDIWVEEVICCNIHFCFCYLHIKNLNAVNNNFASDAANIDKAKKEEDVVYECKFDFRNTQLSCKQGLCIKRKLWSHNSAKAKDRLGYLPTVSFREWFYVEESNANKGKARKENDIAGNSHTMKYGDIKFGFPWMSSMEQPSKNEDLDTGIDDYPSYCDDDKKIHIDCAHNLKFSCMIEFEFTDANFFPLLYVNMMSRKFHNSIMKNKMVYKGNNVVGALMNVPIFVETFSVMTYFAVLENMDAYRDEGMNDVIFGEPFLREVDIKAKRFEGMITLYKGDEVTYQIVLSHPRFKHHINEQCNKIPPLLKVNEKDMMHGVSHAYQKLKGFYKGVLNLGSNYIHNAKTEEWLTRGYQDRNAPVFPIFYARPREGNIDKYWWRIYESGNLEVLES
ncbi:putative reverse transcriptase domain-containing protein [Tanacetum coccineum]